MIVELTTAVVLSTVVARASAPDAHAWWIAGSIAVAGVVHGEIALRIERTRRRLTDTLHVDLTSVWTFAAIVLVPTSLAVAITALLQLHLWTRAWAPQVPLYRMVFTIATMALGCVGAGAALAFVDPPGADASAPHGFLAIGVAILVYATVNTALIAGAVVVSSAKPDLTSAVGDVDENLLEIAALSFGALIGLAVTVNPWLAWLGVVPLYVLHRATLTRQLQTAADVDAKTGLLNAAAWHTHAERELARPRRTGHSAVLVIDLDDFKAVNDMHGHLVGDTMLTAAADAIRSQVRDSDLVGRFGGDEFVVLLANTTGVDEADAVAARIVRQISRTSIEIPTGDGPVTLAAAASIGAASYPSQGTDLGELMHAADTQLYERKRARPTRLPRSVAAPRTVDMAVEQAGEVRS